MTAFDVVACARHEQQREAEEAQRAQQMAADARAEARRIAGEIATVCGTGVERVVLFGSLAQEDVASREPDIDLAVWATPGAFLRSVSVALRSRFSVDVIDPRTATAHLQESIRRDGVVLHAR